MNSTFADDKEKGAITLAPNIPHIYTISYETVNRASHFTYAIGGGYVPPLSVSTATVSAMNIEAKARWHPFGGAFFLGSIAGYHSYSGSGSTNVTILAQSVPVTVTDKLSGMYITPHLGWDWFFGKLIVGLEGGTQIGIGSSNNISLSVTDPSMQALIAQVQADTTYKAFESSIDSSVKTLTSLPYFAFKLGWKL